MLYTAGIKNLSMLLELKALGFSNLKGNYYVLFSLLRCFNAPEFEIAAQCFPFPSPVEVDVLDSSRTHCFPFEIVGRHPCNYSKHSVCSTRHYPTVTQQAEKKKG
ncbi:hypothetical protein Dimus_009853 [Dionaea muscipula]